MKQKPKVILGVIIAASLFLAILISLEVLLNRLFDNILATVFFVTIAYAVLIFLSPTVTYFIIRKILGVELR